MKRHIARILLHSSFIGMMTAACVPTVRFPIVTHSPDRFFKSFGRMQTIGVYVVDNENMKTDWKTLTVGSIENELHNYGYFNLVDVSHRQDLLQELAFQASGVTRDSTQIGLWDETEGLLFLEFFQKPVFCQKEGGLLPAFKSFIFLRASLVEVKSSRKLSITLNDPLVTNACGQESALLSQALRQISAKVVAALSPQVAQREIRLYDTVDDVAGKDQQARVKRLLRSGVEWVSADPPNFDYAKRDWDQAFKESGGISTSAAWNLGIYFWHERDYARAESLFQRSLAGADSDSDRKRIYGLFSEEKKWFEEKLQQ